ncbi:MAG: EAL domain-containing protein [Acidimicrobiales bacterium]|jgi:diguanylate cyclase (GGDEF)-like protein/PAS domain S-box-containing protein
MAPGPPFEQPTARAAVVTDAIEAWSVFEQFFVLSYRSAPGIPVLINDLSIRSGTVLGIAPDSVLNDSELFSRLLHPDDRDRVLNEHWEAAANAEPFVSEYRMVSQDGTILWVYDRAVPVTDASGATTLYGSCLDITPRERTETGTMGTDERLRSVVANIPGAVYRCACDEAWTVEYLSDQIQDLVGYPASDFVGSGVRTYDSIVHPDDLACVVEEVSDALERSCSYSLEYRLIHVSGEIRWVAEHGRPVLGPDGRKQRTVGVILDITRQKAAEKSREIVERRLRNQALHDSLTGLANRTLFRASVVRAISEAERNGSELAVFVMDLDGFKEVNDALGHVSGDRVLKEVAHRLQEALRESDAIARFGSDEFAVLVTQARRAQVLEVVRRVRGAVEQSIDLEGLPVNLGVSIGISAFPRDGADVDTLLRCADTAMYLAKDTDLGYAFYDASVDTRAATHLGLIGDLRHAIEDQELVLHYQPKIAVRSGQVVGVEALVRWHHPARGLMMPSEFVPVAKETSLIKELTLHVIDEAGRQWRAWADEGRRLPIAVNLSLRDLVDPGFPGEVAALIGKWRMPATMLKLEVTESAVVEDPKRTEDVLERLGAMGLRFSVDDFGTGYFSLAYLKRLPIDEIKIDRSFVAAMTVHEEDEVIVRSTIDLGHSLGLSVVAEGVETRSVMERLAPFGCDVAQGYYLGRPMPPDEFDIWLDHHPASGEPTSGKRKFREGTVLKSVASA